MNHEKRDAASEVELGDFSLKTLIHARILLPDFLSPGARSER